ncbi:MAG TPA: hypothetical protein VKS19_07385, partial [Verrucomicrobiae bacterium]|nr:hypothetical protein [Verrucomicrobiae bacterium]
MPHRFFYYSVIFFQFTLRLSTALSCHKWTPTGFDARICDLPVIGSKAHIAGTQVVPQSKGKIYGTDHCSHRPGSSWNPAGSGRLVDC